MKKESPIHFSKIALSWWTRKALLIAAILFAGCVEVPRETIPFSVDPQVAVRGKVLVEGFAACGFCHGSANKVRSSLTGGRLIQTEQGSVKAPNITPSKSGIGSWDMEDLLLALRGVQSQDPEKEFFGSVHQSYRWMSQEDAYAVLSYLRILDPVERSIPREHESNSMFGTTNVTNPGFVPSSKPISEVSVGRYLANNVARCTECHATREKSSSWYMPSFIFGTEDEEDRGKLIEFEGRSKEAPLLFNRFTKQEMLAFFDTGAMQKRRPVDSSFCPTQYFKNAPTEQKQAIAAFFAAKR